MKRTNLSLALLALPLFFSFTCPTVEQTPQKHKYENDQDKEYYCTNCNTKLQKASRSVWVNTQEDCYNCGGDGKVNSVDRNGNIIRNANTCPACDGSGKKKELVIEKYLKCPKCNSEYQYME